MPKPKGKAWIYHEDPLARAARTLWCKLDKNVASEFKKKRTTRPMRKAA